MDVGDKMTGVVCALPLAAGETAAEVEGSEIEKLNKGCVVVVVVVVDEEAAAAVADAGTVWAGSAAAGCDNGRGPRSDERVIWASKISVRTFFASFLGSLDYEGCSDCTLTPTQRACAERPEKVRANCSGVESSNDATARGLGAAAAIEAHDLGGGGSCDGGGCSRQM